MTAGVPAGGGASGISTQVLVVDDEYAVRLVLARALAWFGYQAFLAASGTDALTELGHLAVDAVVSDVTLPGMSGLDLASETHRSYPGAPVLFVTVSAVPESLLRGALVGAIGKPPSPAGVHRELPEVDPRRPRWRRVDGERCGFVQRRDGPGQ